MWGGGITPLQRYSQYILQPQPPGQTRFWGTQNIYQMITDKESKKKKILNIEFVITVVNLI